MIDEDVKGNSVEVFRPDYVSVALNGFEGLDLHGYIQLPESATLKQIKDFQQQSESMIADLKNDIFKTS